MRRERVRRWQGALAGTLVLAVAALLFANQTLLLAAAVPLVYVLYGTVSTVPATVDLAVSREFEPSTPAPGEPVEVTLTITNESRRLLPDVRVVDGVPETVPIEDGPPGAGASLLPGAATTVRYTVVARQGNHEFDEPTLRLRSLSGTRQATTTAAVDGETTLACATAVRDRSVRRDATTVTTGSGIEFHATRQYRRGDPMRRVDWRHVAKTGEFVTIQYREDDPTPTVVVVDARPVGRVSPAPGYPSALALCVDSARRIHARLDRAGVATAVAAVGLDDLARDDRGTRVRDGVAWVPGSAPDRRWSVLFDDMYAVTAAERATDGARDGGTVVGSPAASSGADTDGNRPGVDRPEGTLAAGWTGDPTDVSSALDGDDSETIARLLRRLPTGARVVLCTPLLDDWPIALGRAVAGRDSLLVVVSPDVLGETPGQRIAHVHRKLRLRALDGFGQTVDWTPEQPPEHRVGGLWTQP